jgi:glucosamine--fructose-6-phosphate aminotransferase (isomerizing)
MAHEIGEAPAAIARQEAGLARPIAELVAQLERRPPRVVVTCARGTSAHAATFAKHLLERHLGIPVAEAAPNIASVYGRRLGLEGQLFLAISQSGRSDDLIEMAHSARATGALAAALVNDAESPLARACDIVLPMAAGPELSVAASKTFVATLAVL